MRYIPAIDKKQELSVSVLEPFVDEECMGKSVSKKTIKNCFRHAGCALTNDEAAAVEDTDDPDDEIPLNTSHPG